VYECVKRRLIEKGFDAPEKGSEGFIHSAGHGVGLEVHESPSIGKNKDVLKDGMVITIEPGLYYRDVGGVRMEDIVVVRENGYERLSTLSTPFLL
jgi:Xaa-Pro aminopeptidase